ncbi:MAG: sigma-54-dependent transcriptional regulator [Gemmatimonadales bacterium]
MTRVLIVDDLPHVAEQQAYDLRRVAGHETIVAAGGDAALALLESHEVDAIVLDLEMPGTDGFTVLAELARKGIETPVIVYTGTGNFDRCVQAVRLGAYGFVAKDEPVERVAQEIASALERRRLRHEVFALQSRLGESSLVGRSKALEDLRAQVGRLAAIPSPVLILGESGSGKELVARDLHRLGPGATQPFVPINCAALPDQLIESELFGHERGAFTGAVAARAGAFEAAGRGTLFLDEVGELAAQAQAKLLRAIEAREVTRLGAVTPRKVEARLLAATHRDLERDVAERRFREDLLFRLNVHVLRVPALRERREDIPLIARRFLDETCARFGLLPRKLSDEAAAALASHDWRRNNARELRNAVERAVVAADGEVIRLEHLPPEVRGERGDGEAPQGYRELKLEAERRIVVAALERHGWQVTRTAEALGLSDHASLLKILRRLGIRRE